MTFMEGFPDVILGSWRGSSQDNQPIDDQTIYIIIQGDEENQYRMKITQLGPALRRAKFQQDEIVGWINASEEPGFYQGKFKLRYAGSGLEFFNTSTIELVSYEELHHIYENGEKSVQHRISSIV